MDACSFNAIVLPSMFAIKNKIEGTPCHEDLSCIGYTLVVSLGFAYGLYRVLTRNMSKKGRREALWKFFFRDTKN
tara:strand:- start:745 stop:969 length:225 start_codon:yes stop_codon:yes gene_type:complete